MKSLFLLLIASSFFPVFWGQAQQPKSKNSEQAKWAKELLDRSDMLLYNEPSKSLNFAKEALNIAEILDDEQLKALSCNRIGLAYWSKGDLNESLEWMNTSLDKAFAIGDLDLAARNLGNIGNVYDAADMNLNAIDFYREALDIFSARGDSNRIFVYNNNIAKSYLDRKELDSVEKYLNLALESICNDCIQFKGLVILKFAEMEYLRDNLDLADSLIDESLSIAEIYEDKRTVSRANRLMAEIGMKREDVDGIEKSALFAYEIAMESQSKELIQVTSETLSKVYREKGDFKKSLEMLHIATAYKDSLQGAVVRRQLMILEKEREQRGVRFTSASGAFLKGQSEYLLSLIVLLFLGVGVLAYFLIKTRREIKSISSDLAQCLVFKEKANQLMQRDIRANTSTLIDIVTLVEENPEQANVLMPLLPSFKKNAKQTMELLDSLGQMVQMNSNSQETDEKVDLGAIASQIVAQNFEEAAKKGLEIENEIEEGEVVISRSDSITTILNNLVSNSIRFSDEGVLSVYSLRIGNTYKLIVRDEGVGMSEEQLKLLFTENQIVTKGTRGETGSGLGLQLVKKLAEEISAEIEVKSEEGVGTAISIALPI